MDRVLKSFSNYYDIKTESPLFPFCAEAVFKAEVNQYFLVKPAKISSSVSKEFVFFYKTELLTPELLSELEKISWNECLKRTEPFYGHRNSDSVLIIIAQEIPFEVQKKIKKINHYKSYKATFFGWSTFKILCYSIEEKKAFYNRRGKELKKIFSQL
ncbi:MAG: hypothetical protein PUJ82_00590 [Spirochaetales bacterium]|nr:hypothetical protein [Spirochaetales bacterium]